MGHMPTRRYHEGFNIGRLLMVLSSISPLFILWAIKGTSIIPDPYLIPFCAVMVILPSVYFCWRIRRARIKRDKQEIVIGEVHDYRYHILTYIFAMLLPFYRQDIASTRELLAVCAALVFIVVLFWKLNLHYINLMFIVRGYQIFMVDTHDDGNPYSGRENFMLITRRPSVEAGQEIMAYRVSDTVYLE